MHAKHTTAMKSIRKSQEYHFSSSIYTSITAHLYTYCSKAIKWNSPKLYSIFQRQRRRKKRQGRPHQRNSTTHSMMVYVRFFVGPLASYYVYKHTLLGENNQLTRKINHLLNVCVFFVFFPVYSFRSYDVVAKLMFSLQSRTPIV